MDSAYDHLGTLSEAIENLPSEKDTSKSQSQVNTPTKTSEPGSAKLPSIEKSDNISNEPTEPAKPSTKPLVNFERTFTKAADTFEHSVNDVYTHMTNAATAASTSTWGSVLGGFWSKVKQQGEATIKVAVNEINETKLELAELKSEIDELITGEKKRKPDSQKETSTLKGEESAVSSIKGSGKVEETAQEVKDVISDKQLDQPKGMLALLTNKAQKYIDDLDKDLEQFENKAGKKLVQMGTDIQGILKEAVNKTGPTILSGQATSSDTSNTKESHETLFNVPEDIQSHIYSTRLDAQLHALHTTREPFLVKDANTVDPGYTKFAESFNVDAQTENIAQDLEKYTKLRSLMESLVPDSVAYNEFWTRYYFMRSEIYNQEEKRKLLLSQAQNVSLNEEEVNWDDEDEDEDNKNVEPKKDMPVDAKTDTKPTPKQKSDLPLNTEPVGRNEKTAMSFPHNPPLSSRPSSESSYDLVSSSPSAIDLTANTTSAAVIAAATSGPSSSQTTISKPEPIASTSQESDSDDDWE